VTLSQKTVAVVVGIEQYATGWKLDGPASDACRFVDWLLSENVPAGNISLLVSPLPDNMHLVEEHRANGVRVNAGTYGSISGRLIRDLPKESSELLIVHWGGHGCVDGAGDRRLLCADAEFGYMQNLDLNSMLRSLASSRYDSHPRQLLLVDACQTFVQNEQWASEMPKLLCPEGQLRKDCDQQVLLAASPGERARNDDANKTGLFSKVVREEISWPPNAEGLRDRVHDRFEEFRAKRQTKQVPSHLWFRSRSGETVLVFTTDVEASAGPLGAALISHEDYRPLRQILRGATVPAGLRHLHHEVTRNVVDLPVLANPEDLIAVVQNLRQPMDPRPLFEFLVRFSSRTDPVTRVRLWEWIEDMAPPYGVDLVALRALHDELRRTVILLRVEPDRISSGLQVTAWRYVGEDGTQLFTSDVPWQKDELAAALSDQIGGFDPERDDVAPLVEFMVPTTLLDEDLESLQVHVMGRDREVGTVCPVVVRPIERLAATDAQQRHMVNWQTFVEKCGTYHPGAILWLDAEPCTDTFDSCVPKDHVCLALAYTPAGLSGRRSTVTLLLEAGTPIAVWHRATRSPEARRQPLEQVLQGKALHDLPDIVREKRIAARHPMAPPDHAGRDLVLLWDDPGRVPQDLCWQAPDLEGAMS
jgi:hypothetical protein